MDSAYLQWKHVSFKKWSFVLFLCCVFFITRTSTKFGHRRWTRVAAFELPNRFFSARKRPHWNRPWKWDRTAIFGKIRGGFFFFLGMDGSVGIFYPGHGFLFQESEDFPWPRRFFSSSPWWLLQGKKATSATEMDGIFMTVECQNAFKETVAFKVPFVSLWLCCFGRVVALKEIREYILYRRF